jgi:hypothetical protein
MVLQRLNRWYLDEQKRGDVVAELPIKRDDFKRNSDVIPVSDPHIFSETQRMAQTQAVMSYMEKFPQLFDPRAVIGRALKQMKIPNIQELMPQYQKPVEMSSSDENAAMAMGRMATAYPRQDHLAHIKAHLAFAENPILGANPIIAPNFVPRVLEHLKQHMMLWYTQKMDNYTIVPAGVEREKYEDTKTPREIDRAMAVAAEHVNIDTQEQLNSFMPSIAKLMQIMQQFKPQPQLDGEAQAILQASMAETQRRAARDQQDGQLKVIEMQQKDARENKAEQFKAAMNAENNLTEERMKTLDLSVEAARLKREQQETAVRLNESVQRRLGG